VITDPPKRSTEHRSYALPKGKESLTSTLTIVTIPSHAPGP
jgi:hypothetical protein